MRRVGITDHAVERYRERVKPELGPDAARTELLALTRDARAVEPPAWMRRREAGPTFLLGPGVYAVCCRTKGRSSRWQMTTILTEALASDL